MQKTFQFGLSNSMYNAFSRYPYTQATALAEFIDNAIDSYEKNKDLLKSKYGPEYKLNVCIDVEWEDKTDNGRTYAKKITIKDNAAGLDQEAFYRAGMAGETPKDTNGLSEFGLGLKFAAFWYGKHWKLESCSITEDKARILDVYLDKVASRKDNSYTFEEIDKDPNWDFNTRITLMDLLHDSNPLTKSTINGVKKNLASTYRTFLRDDSVRIYVNNEPLTFEDLKFLKAPYYKNLDGPDIEWKFYFSTPTFFGKFSVKGFIGILDRFHQGESGLVLLRRGRVVVGQSFKDRYTPKCIFGTDTKGYKCNLIYGELQIDGFDVAFGKTDIKNHTELDELIENLVVKAGKLKKGDNDLIQEVAHVKTVKDYLEKKEKAEEASTDSDNTESTKGGENGKPETPNNGNGGSPNGSQGQKPTTGVTPTPNPPKEPNGDDEKPQTSPTGDNVPTVKGKEYIKDKPKQNGSLVNCVFTINNEAYTIKMVADSSISKFLEIDAKEFANKTIVCKIKTDGSLLKQRANISGELLEMIRAVVASYLRSKIEGDKNFSINSIIEAL